MKTKTKIPFSRLTAAQKRVAIARDALKQIKAQKLEINTGVWCDIEMEEVYPDVEKLDAQALFLGRAAVPAIQPTCRTCALGACLVSSVRLFDDFKLKTSDLDVDEIYKQLKKFFPVGQLLLIESAFEQRDWTDRSTSARHGQNVEKHITEAENTTAENFGLTYKDDTERAEAIFKNIVRNNGTFKP